MGIVRSYLGNYFPEGDVDRIEDKMKAGVGDRSRGLEEEIEKLSLVLRAVLDQLVARKVLSRQDIQSLILAIDQADGVTDGTSTRVPTGRPDDAKSKARRKSR